MNPQEIKALRKKARLNTKDFGELVGVKAKTVEAWEQGVRNPSGPARKMLESMK